MPRAHVMNPSLLSIDGLALELLALEAELARQGIPTAFDPVRPGEGVAWSRSLARQIGA